MKIFNWMQRKLHPATDYSPVYPKKAPKGFEESTGELSAVALPPMEATDAPYAEVPLLRHALEGTILTIGTLGHPLLLLQFREEEPGLDPPQKDSPAPPMPESGPMARTLPRPQTELLMIHGSGDASGAGEADAEEKTMVEPLLKAAGERKDRTTLAELFAADPASPAKCSLALKITGGDENKKKKVDKVNSLQSPKSRRLHRMIKRMVKNKIHPELDSLSRKNAGRVATKLQHDGYGGHGGGGVP